ncbi:hypothetical protein ARHIZOSPH14_05770 [Agromyces rhizosphaerae]|uniref:Uncharacterized protein n=1 Tax=Agromyces rhizosphaerae TaxID=88374 RepID=A0A9W6CTX9_9MICO|nr:hypothetical protein [Agromyces rhizosphaerae]GLI26335.1 hypothetical protein ARHIZOSPH14_05770 [Agromyces rhizosphaerae]
MAEPQSPEATSETSTAAASKPSKSKGGGKKRGKKQRTLIDIIAVFVLSVTAVLTAWCGFEASKWGGEMSIAFSQASSARIQATNFEGEARDSRMFDLVIWATYVEAIANGDDALADYVEERFTPHFAVAFEDWNAGGREEAGPFGLDSYVPPGTEEAAELGALADQKFQEALDNNQRGDDYSLLTVLFALVLFLSAMAQRDISSKAAWGLLGMALVVAVVGIVILTTFPIKI